MPSKVCAKCGRSYAEESQVCEDCEEALVEAEEPSGQQGGDIVPLTTLPSVEEAMVLVNVLESEGIPATIEDMTLLCWTQGTTPTGPGGVRVLVNSEDSDAALEILESHRQGELALPDEDEPESVD